MDAEEARNALKEARQRVEALMTEEKWVDAHMACLEVLRYDPENIGFIRLKNKIEKNVRKINQKALKKDMDSLKPLLEQENYDELLPSLKKLEPYAEDYLPLKNFIYKARTASKNKIASQQENYINQEIENIAGLASKNEYPEAVRLAERLRTLALREAQLRSIITDLRKRWIDYELDTNGALLKSEKYEDLLIFLQGMLRIDNKSQKLKKLIENAKKEYQSFKIREKRETIYKELERIKTLYQQKKYDLAMESAREILDMDPSNRAAKSYFVKARKQVRKKEDNEVLEQMKTSRRQIKEDYRKNKKDFIKI